MRDQKKNNLKFFFILVLLVIIIHIIVIKVFVIGDSSEESLPLNVPPEYSIEPEL
ncbi:MAG: hypothetical protein IJW31_04850 [Lentisphaeria bacterium]|nr:hypothetical protein [Lentisphaeria bacterium]MBR7128477.1 hypothetical protein [Lentisphaeria bacterium]